MKIEHLAFVIQRLETVSKAFRDDKGTMVVGTQYLSMPSQKSRRITAQIYGDVKNFSAQAVYELRFGMRCLLKVQAPYRSTFRSERVVDLLNPLSGNQSLQFSHAKEPFKIAPAIADRLVLKDVQAGNRGGQNVKTPAQVDSAVST